MKLIKCDNCKRFITIEKPGTGMCMCGHSFFRVLTTKKVVDKTTGKNITSVKEVMVWGECSVWYIPDKDLAKAKPGDVLNIQWQVEPHPNIKRVNKGTILFYDRG